MNSLNEEDDSEEEEEDFDVEMENEVQVSGRAEEIERLLLNHEDSCMRQSQFTRLPCSAHKVHLVSDKSINPKHISFGHSIKKLHCQVQNILEGQRCSSLLSQWDMEPEPVKPEGWREIWLFTTESPDCGGSKTRKQGRTEISRSYSILAGPSMY